ncbi:MAG: radical SAM protein [Candidatus Izemoplasmatales bacterium]|nr:radical SAM protein [Candidatus Izemoplasmatales bacterium]
MNYVYGPIPSRRLGKSLGISPISKKTCNLSCVYCMLGLTDKMTNDYVSEFSVKAIINELKTVLDKIIAIDVITIVGEGEPTLYEYLGDLIDQIKEMTDIPVAIITNGTRFTEELVYQASLKADIVLPSIDAYDKLSFKKINRPHKALVYEDIVKALIKFSHEFSGELWLETMICKEYNDSDETIKAFKELLKDIKYDKLYINSPVRPPAIETVKSTSHERLELISKELGGINIDVLADPDFYSDITDSYQAILSIIRRHPMNQFEISAFLKTREYGNIDKMFEDLRNNEHLQVVNYKGYDTFLFKVGE